MPCIWDFREMTLEMHQWDRRQVARMRRFMWPSEGQGTRPESTSPKWCRHEAAPKARLNLSFLCFQKKGDVDDEAAAEGEDMAPMNEAGPSGAREDTADLQEVN